MPVVPACVVPPSWAGHCPFARDSSGAIAFIRPLPVDCLFGDDHIHADVVRQAGDFGKHLALETHGQTRRIAAGAMKESVVIALSISQAAAATVERQAGDHDQIRLRRRDLPVGPACATRASAPRLRWRRTRIRRNYPTETTRSHPLRSRAPRRVSLPPTPWARTTGCGPRCECPDRASASVAGILLGKAVSCRKICRLRRSASACFARRAAASARKCFFELRTSSIVC